MTCPPCTYTCEQGKTCPTKSKQVIADLESQEPVAIFYLPIRKDMREDVEALIDHAKRARWTNVVVRKDAVETTYEADWIKELIPYTPPQRTEPASEDFSVAQKRTWVGLTPTDWLQALKDIDPETKRLPQGFSLFACAIEDKLKEKNT
jgi:hypothetical protein